MIYVNDMPIEKTIFPDGTFKTDLDKIVLDEEGKLLSRFNIRWNYESDVELFELYAISRQLSEIYFDKNQYLYIPYLPNARMDRTKSPHEVFTLKYFCEIINSLNFKRIYTLDVHSDVSMGMLNRAFNSSIKDLLFTVKDELPNADDICVFVPDNGAAKRYGNDVSEVFNKPCGFGVKNRDWKTGEIKGLILEFNGVDVKDKDVLIIDDICSKGGTFYHTAKALKEAGAKDIYLYATHCEETILKGELLKDNGLIKQMFTTDSICDIEHDKLRVIKLGCC